MKNREEYLRRNAFHAASVGAEAEVKRALDRIYYQWGRRPLWLIQALKAALVRVRAVRSEMAVHRDEVAD